MEKKQSVAAATTVNKDDDSKIKTRSGSGYLKQLYSTARSTAGTTHTGLKGLTTFLVNFIPTDKVDASELQVRVHFDDEEVQALAHSIKDRGEVNVSSKGQEQRVNGFCEKGIEVAVVNQI